MKRDYPIIEKHDSRALAAHLARNGELLLPLVDLIEGSRVVIDELIDVVGRAAIEAVLELSAEKVAGPRHQGKQGGEIRRHGTQKGTVQLSDRKLRVTKTRLRRRGGGPGAEVPIPAYEALNADERSGRRVLEILLRGVSTRSYGEVVPEMAESVGLSKSAVSREFKAASERELRALCERRFGDVELLAIYMDGVQFGAHHVIVALGVDDGGNKHVLGLREGATENGVVVRELLADLVERGVRPDRQYLFIIDGSKALRAAIEEVFGDRAKVQRCRTHKLRNVIGYLPKELHAQVKSTMRAAWKLDAEQGMARLRQQAHWLEGPHPDAAASLLEGLEEMFTVNRMGLSPTLSRSLTTTNIIENPNGGVRRRTRRVSRWQDGSMVKRWAAAAYLDAEKRFRRIMGFRDLWMLKVALNRHQVVDAAVEVA